MGKILGRYILREVVTAWIVVMGVLLVILLANQVAAVLERAAAAQFPQAVVFELIYLGMLQYLSILVPFGLLLGIVLALGRLYHDTELAAAFACGVRPATLYGGVIGLGVVLAAGLAALTLVVAPGATEQALHIRNAAVRAGQFAPLQAGTFRSFAGGTAVVYAERVDRDGTLRNVFVEHNQGSVVEVTLAQRAVQTVAPDAGTQTIELFDGQRFEGIPGSAQFRSMPAFAELTIPVRLPPASGVVTDLDARPTAALLASPDPKSQAKLQWRISMPLMCIVLTVLAVPLSRLRPRQGRYARVLPALGVFLIYWNLISAGQAWIARGAVPVALGLWWTHAAVVLLALGVIFAPQALATAALPPREAGLSILDRYILRTVLGAVALVLIVLLILGGLFVFISQQGDIGVGHYTVVDALWYTLLNLPQQIYQLLPITALIGSVIGFGQLARGSEITVIRATGVSVARLAGSALIAAALLIAFEAAVGEFMAPQLQEAANQQKAFSQFNSVGFGGGTGAWVRDGDLILNVARQSGSRQFVGMQVFQLSPQHTLVSIGHAASATTVGTPHLASRWLHRVALHR